MKTHDDCDSDSRPTTLLRLNRAGAIVGRSTASTASITTIAREPYYFLTMLPYTSGDLHIGHWYAMAPSDVGRALACACRARTCCFPLGYDAFGLPAENAAINNNTHPKQWTYNNIEEHDAPAQDDGRDPSTGRASSPRRTPNTTAGRSGGS